MCYLTKNRACGVNDTACTILAFENLSSLGEFEAEFKKTLARESGATGVLFDEKKPKVENLVTLSLSGTALERKHGKMFAAPVLI
jgi:hypothetical protein